MVEVSKCIICESSNLIKLLKCKDYFLSQEDFTIIECKDCGFRFTNPVPEKENLLKYYQSQDYLSHLDKPEKLIDKIYNRVREYNVIKKYKLVSKFKYEVANNPKQKRTILDIGCGTGEFLNQFRINNWNTTGIEPNKQAREIAEKRNKLSVYDESKYKEFENNYFDVITMWHSLEHIPDLQGQIKTIKRILKKDGVLVVAVPNSDSPDAQIYREYWAAYDVPRHLYHFNKKSIKELFNKFELQVNDIKPMKLDAYYVSMLSEKYKRVVSHKTLVSSNINFNILIPIWNGLVSNLRARKNNNYSSLIYIIRNQI
jgi:ubiquinone/menaquinone biosynthesis C-methylase UbiE